MRRIKLTQNKYALVDNEDFEFLNQFKWYVNDNGYACRCLHIKNGVNNYKSKIIKMHRIVNNTPEGVTTDHINKNKLDNRKSNLRTVTKSQNGINRNAPSNNKSGVKGVYFDNWSKKWRAEIKLNYKKITLGRFSKIKDAIFARQKAEQIYHAI